MCILKGLTLTITSRFLTQDTPLTQRWEDAIIAWTWRQYSNEIRDNNATYGPEILLRFPMTKVGNGSNSYKNSNGNNVSIMNEIIEFSGNHTSYGHY